MFYLILLLVLSAVFSVVTILYARGTGICIPAVE